MQIDRAWVDAAAGRITIDLLLKDVQLVNVFSGEIRKTDVAYRSVVSE